MAIALCEDEHVEIAVRNVVEAAVPNGLGIRRVAVDRLVIGAAEPLDRLRPLGLEV
jgi:hypothetical protein